ncbi:MAG: hypothetical protein GFGODING_02606 [Flavobacteriales bacterium]|nr:hypothetical protein [Flavobacteriales bacterium]
MSDPEIVEALRGGNQLVQSRAVDVLLRQLKPAIIHYVRSNSGSHEEGVTMANEAVVVLWEKVGTGGFTLLEGTKLSTWCIRVGMNLWLKELRRRRIRPVDNHAGGMGNEAVEGSTPLDIITTVEEHEFVSEDTQRAWRAFKKLSTDCQRLFQADMADRLEQEIMHELAMTNLGSVKVKRHRCKAKWIEFYKQEAPVHSHARA